MNIIRIYKLYLLNIDIEPEIKNFFDDIKLLLKYDYYAINRLFNRKEYNGFFDKDDNFLYCYNDISSTLNFNEKCHQPFKIKHEKYYKYFQEIINFMYQKHIHIRDEKLSPNAIRITFGVLLK